MHETFHFECADDGQYLNNAFLVLSFEFFTQHEASICKQFEGTDFKFDTYSYSSRNIQTRCVCPNVTYFAGNISFS